MSNPTVYVRCACGEQTYTWLYCRACGGHLGRPSCGFCGRPVPSFRVNGCALCDKAIAFERSEEIRRECSVAIRPEVATEATSMATTHSTPRRQYFAQSKLDLKPYVPKPRRYVEEWSYEGRKIKTRTTYEV